MTTPGPAVDLIDYAAGIIVEAMRVPRTAPFHWAGALWEAGVLTPPGPAGVPAEPPPVSRCPTCGGARR